MKKLITNNDDIIEIYFESGKARLRFKDGWTRETCFPCRPQKLLVGAGRRINKAKEVVFRQDSDIDKNLLI